MYLLYLQEFYVREYPQLEGMTFGAIRHHFPQACVAGIIMAAEGSSDTRGGLTAPTKVAGPAPSGTLASAAGLGKKLMAAAAGLSQMEAPSTTQLLELAPHDDRVLQPGESLVLVASDAESMTPTAEPYEVGSLLLYTCSLARWVSMSSSCMLWQFLRVCNSASV